MRNAAASEGQRIFCHFTLDFPDSTSKLQNMLAHSAVGGDSYLGTPFAWKSAPLVRWFCAWVAPLRRHRDMPIGDSDVTTTSYTLAFAERLQLAEAVEEVGALRIFVTIVPVS